METILEGAHYEGKGQSFKAGNRSVFISAADMKLVEEIRQLPIATRLAIVGVGSISLEKHLQVVKRNYVECLHTNVKIKNWRWRDTGEKVVWDDVPLPGPVSTRRKLLRMLKKDPCQLSIEQLNLYIDWFVGNKANIYTTRNK